MKRLPTSVLFSIVVGTLVLAYSLAPSTDELVCLRKNKQVLVDIDGAVHCMRRLRELR